MNTICSIQHIRDDNPLCASFSIRVAGSGSVRITGEFPSVLAMQYKLDIRDEKYHHRIFNMEAMPLTLHSIMTFASYLRRQFKLEPTTRDIARDILNDTYDEYPDFVQYIISVQKKNRKDKDLMLYCIAKGIRRIFSGIADFHSDHCFRAENTPTAYAFEIDFAFPALMPFIIHIRMFRESSNIFNSL